MILSRQASRIGSRTVLVRVCWLTIIVFRECLAKYEHVTSNGIRIMYSIGSAVSFCGSYVYFGGDLFE